MGVWLDDEFPEHPKVEALDDDLARWLYVAGLCYANRNLTGGRIPKGAALRLTDKVNPKLIRRLLDVLVPGKGPLWEDHGDHYRIHDYDQHQQSAEKRRSEIEDAKRRRSEHARKAAQARHGAPNEQQLSMDRASPEQPPEQPPSTPGAVPEQPDSLARPRVTRPADPTPLALSTGSSSSHHGLGERGGESEEESLNNAKTQAVALIAERQLEVRLAKTDLGPVGDRAGWLKSARAKVWVDHGGELGDLVAQGLHPSAMADRIMPPVTSSYPKWEPPATDEPVLDVEANRARLAEMSAGIGRRVG